MSLSFYESQSEISVISFRDTLHLASNFIDNIIETVEDMEYTFNVEVKLNSMFNAKIAYLNFLDKYEVLGCFRALRSFKSNKQTIITMKKQSNVTLLEREGDHFLVSCIHQAGLRYAVVKQIEIDRLAKIVLLQSFYRGRLVRLVSKLLLINHRIEQENKLLMRKYRNHNSIKVIKPPKLNK